MGNSADATPLRLLMIGPLPPPLGGTTVSFRQLAMEMRQLRDLHVEIIDTSRGNNANGFLRNTVVAARAFWRVMRALGKTQVATFHASSTGTVNFGLILYALCKIFGVPLVVREFGGCLDNDYEKMSLVARWAIRVVFRSDRVLLQTHNLTDYFSVEFPWSNCEWYSNSRPLRIDAASDSVTARPARRFVYVGHVKATKGLQEVLVAAEGLPNPDCRVDVFGPLLDGFTEHAFDSSSRVVYRGVLNPGQVIPTLRRYDVVLLPTYHFGEGYPGIILEAYSAGRPVISTRWRSIPEIVEHGVSGLLVEPRNAGDLEQAMCQLCEDPRLLRTLTEGARAFAHRFDSKRWTGKFVEVCRQVLAERLARKRRGR